MRFSTEVGKLDKVELGKRCLEARTKTGLSQRQMAARMGYSSPTVISNKEKGNTYPSVEDIYFLSKLSGFTIEWLVTGVNLSNRLYCMDEGEKTLLTQYRLLNGDQKASMVLLLMELRLGITHPKTRIKQDLAPMSEV